MSTHNLCFGAKIRKNNVYPCKHQFHYIKVGFKGSKLYRYVKPQFYYIKVGIKGVKIL